MPGFGLDGPWRDYVGWALNIEQVSGMTAATGYPEGPPCNVQGPADPIVGVHAGVALLAALEHRRRTGEGQLIEIAQIEVGAAVTAEPVIDYSMNGLVRPREGNRRRSGAFFVDGLCIPQIGGEFHFSSQSILCAPHALEPAALKRIMRPFCRYTRRRASATCSLARRKSSSKPIWN